MTVYKWERLPQSLQLDEVRPYWERLRKKKVSLFFKRIFDIVFSSMFLIVLSPFFLFLSLAIKLDSKGPVFFRQERITQYGQSFRIHKFRSMVQNADKKGTLVTVSNDNRITKVGHFIRKYKIDELSQLIDVFEGTMSFVGTRPEVKKYVDQYSNEMKATLLLPAGITSTASIKYKDENKLLDAADNVDKVYIEQVLPDKMKYNLKDIQDFGFFKDIGICFKTVFSVFK